MCHFMTLSKTKSMARAGFQDMIRIISRPDRPESKANGDDDDDSVLEDESEDDSEDDSEDGSDDDSDDESADESEGRISGGQDDELTTAAAEARIGLTMTDGQPGTSDQVSAETLLELFASLFPSL